MFLLPDEDVENIKKRNRLKKLSPKTHKISHEHGRSTKTLWAQIIGKSKTKNK